MKVLIGLIGLINANLYDQKNIGIRAGNSEPWRHVGRQDKKNTEFGKRFENIPEIPVPGHLQLVTGWSESLRTVTPSLSDPKMNNQS